MRVKASNHTPCTSSTPSSPARERLLLRGACELSDEELLCVLLGTGRLDAASSTCRRLLRELGGLTGLCRAGGGELTSRAGLGTARASRLLAALELGRRACAAPLRMGQRLHHSGQVYEWFGPGLRMAQTEQFWALSLDTRHRVRAFIPVGRGGLTACPVTAADVFRPLIREAAAATIVLHNHPSGEPDPSPEDVEFTARLCRAGRLVGIPILDHVILGDGKYYSFLDAGRLSPESPRTLTES